MDAGPADAGADAGAKKKKATAPVPTRGYMVVDPVAAATADGIHEERIEAVSAPQYWLLKSEPGTYSFERLQSEKKAVWDGVRNPEARSNLRKMSAGDVCFFYHSGEGKAVVGLARVTREAFQDPTTKDDWSAVEIAAVGPMKKEVTLAQMKADAKLKDMSVVRKSRLSVSPVTPSEFAHVLALGDTKPPKS